MLSFSTQSLAVAAVQVKGSLDRDDQVWWEGDARPVDEVRVTGRLSTAGAGRYYFNGTFAGAFLMECRRCLVEVRSEVGGDAHLIFADSEATEEGGDDPDVFPLSRGRSGLEVDLRPALREQWLLEAPAFVLCRPDCKGLCVTCGANLNLGACSCAQNT
ncbi:MAG TPA: DUF177 domain-containing protein [Gemmatimonadaceae bacterium]|nr:DUF177 domain-containing protein [Gemmatimonadaceae bacterium]